MAGVTNSLTELLDQRLPEWVQTKEEFKKMLIQMSIQIGGKQDIDEDKVINVYLKDVNANDSQVIASVIVAHCCPF